RRRRLAALDGRYRRLLQPECQLYRRLGNDPGRRAVLALGSALSGTRHRAGAYTVGIALSRARLFLLRQDLDQVGDDLIDVLGRHLALLERVVRLDVVLDVEDDGDVGVLGELVIRRAGCVLQREDDVF